MTGLLDDCGCVGCGCVTNDSLMVVRHACVLAYLCLSLCSPTCARPLVLVLDTGLLSLVLVFVLVLHLLYSSVEMRANSLCLSREWRWKQKT